MFFWENSFEKLLYNIKKPFSFLNVSFCLLLRRENTIKLSADRIRAWADTIRKPADSLIVSANILIAFSARWAKRRTALICYCKRSDSRLRKIRICLTIKRLLIVFSQCFPCKWGSSDERINESPSFH